jgi:cellulose synthase/poly-beta-1,6-N-acetylglucosamine synthase-like glycosyltransferase
MNYTIAIPAYNEAKRIEKLIDFLILEGHHQDGNEIIIIDDGSTDETLYICRQYEPEFLTVYPSLKNEGYASAFNNCIQRARKEIMVILDADSLPLRGAIRKLVRPYSLDDKIGATTGRHYLINPKKGLANWLNHIIYETKHKIDSYQAERDNLWHFNGLMMSVRKSIVPETINKETNQDAFLGWMVLNRGYKTAYVPDARSQFKAPSTVKDMINSRNRVCRGHVILGKKYNVSEHIFTELPLPIYVKFIIQSTPRHPMGIAALIFGATIDVYYRIYWLTRYTLFPDSFDTYHWEQIESTKDW